MLIAGLLARGGSLEEGWVEVDGGRIAQAGPGPPPRPGADRHDGIVAPGLVDLQVNGCGGHEVTGGSTALDAIDAVQLAHGVTTYLPTILDLDEHDAGRLLGELAERAAAPDSPVAGVHLEGPFLAEAHAGMHRREALRLPPGEVPSHLVSGAVRLVTLAPELPGATELIARLRARGVAVSLGHSGATAAEARAALDAGAGLVTHLFNGMAPLHHREPGLAGVALTDGRALVTLIADGVHVDPAILELTRRAAGPRVVLISDASPAAAAPAGTYELAGVRIERDEGGTVRTPEGRLGGSSLTLDAAVRGWASLTEATLAEALAAASERPARVLGLPEPLTPGAPADLVLLDPEGEVVRTMRHGRWLD